MEAGKSTKQTRYERQRQGRLENKITGQKYGERETNNKSIQTATRFL